MPLKARSAASIAASAIKAVDRDSDQPLWDQLLVCTSTPAPSTILVSSRRDLMNSINAKPSDGAPPPPLRPILPAHPQSRGPELPQRQFEFKRKRQAAACEPCREHKTKCDGNRPSCNACLRRRTECQFEAEPKETHVQALKRKFDSLQGEASSLQQVYDLLRTRPEGEALSIFRRIRDGDSHDSILQYVHHGDLLMQLSLTSDSSSRTGSDLDRRPRPSSSRSTPQSPLVDRDSGRGTSSATSTQAHTSQEPQASPNKARRHNTTPPSDLYHGCEVVEPLLDEVQPSQWTTVMANDEVMRSLLSQFFQIEYRWWSIFHKDYFLQDMASGDQTHCSSLLVNAVLACAVHASRNAKNRQQYWEPGGNPRYKFFTEARRLWDTAQNSGNDRLTTVQAGLLLSAVHGIDSLDTMGWKCAARSIEMAGNLGLFDSDVEMEDGHDPRAEHARAYTAWSVFCWQSVWCHHFFIPPLVRHPPSHPLPDPHDEPKWYGEIYIRYTSSKHISASGHGHLFKAKADFSKALNSVSDRSFSF
ncbi:hypothetical protein CONLIGDRAFT_715599 [Coniochaeta ligniaria NRRL 30616]|uniref:Zn(2)-C6 fungal-type domain-containing protein n=1 Tax=Coniochaeta ligniaria NRRL 30616 TaxID=1408157 RepID=A0A1J7IPD6_9PEZI|nr:hypothetical protein CONLIGDRAFT_715599 [Coniochaeta ligniaria NRRL 30616]